MMNRIQLPIGRKTEGLDMGEEVICQIQLITECYQQTDVKRLTDDIN
jgi:hypothetical protein